MLATLPAMSREAMASSAKASAATSANVSSSADSIRTELYRAVIHYGFDRGSLDINYRNNKESLDALYQKVQSIGADNIDAIEITSYSSPQGVYEHNLLLAKKRLAAVKSYFKTTYPDLQDKMIFEAGGESWGMLRELIADDSTLSSAQKERAFSVIDADINPGTKKWRMEQLPFYQYLLKTHYTQVRSACAVVVKYHVAEVQPPMPEQPTPEPEQPAEPKQIIEPQPEQPIVEPQPAPVPVPAKEPKVKAPRVPLPFVAALKTDLLYDIVAIPSAGVEIAVGRHLSVAANWQGTWIQSRKRDLFWQTYGGDIEARWWLKGNGRDGRALTGHHVGVYAQALTYDVEFGKTGYQMDKPSVGGGLEYGYAIPIGKHFNLDFELGLGYLGGQQKEYDPQDTHYVWKQTTHLQWFGPTKAGVTLVWIPQFGKKGGKR